MVGCVLVRQGKLVGQGYHKMFGGPHAEIHALKNAGARAKGADLYVNLEPCCHWGKTPPCTDAIIKAGVRKVVSAMPDPNPLVRGKGFQKLRQAGIKVTIGTGRKAAENLNRSFVKYMTRHKPYVTLKSAFSLDGKIAAVSGQSQWITSPQSRKYSWNLRTQSDAILVGAETVRRDNPSLTSHGQGRYPARVVVTSTDNLNPRANIFNGQSPAWIFCSIPPGKPRTANAEWIHLPAGKNRRIALDVLLKELARRGISRLLVEGGGETSAQFIESKEADEIIYFIAPKLIGGRAAKTAIEGNGIRKLADAVNVVNVSVERAGPDLVIRGQVSH